MFFYEPYEVTPLTPIIPLPFTHTHTHRQTRAPWRVPMPSSHPPLPLTPIPSPHPSHTLSPLSPHSPPPSPSHTHPLTPFLPSLPSPLNLPSPLTLTPPFFPRAPWRVPRRSSQGSAKGPEGLSRYVHWRHPPQRG